MHNPVEMVQTRTTNGKPLQCICSGTFCIVEVEEEDKKDQLAVDPDLLDRARTPMEFFT